MIKILRCATPSAEMKQLGEIAHFNEREGRETLIFCEDSLTLEAEKAICEKMGGTFYADVTTYAKYLLRYEDESDVLSAQGSAMVLRKIIDENRDKMKLFKNLAGVDAVDSVYETISRFYASGIKPKDIQAAIERNGNVAESDVLGKKMEDLCLIFSEYEKYLSENGKKDRAGHLNDLPDILRGDADLGDKDVVFFGYREFSKTGERILRAAMESAGNVYGIFCGGGEKFYSNVACDLFDEAARESGEEYIVSDLGDEESVGTISLQADHLRKIIFNPSKRHGEERIDSEGRIIAYEAADAEEEMEYIAAEIKKSMYSGNCRRYQDIAVLIPDVADAQREVKKVFSRHKIPCYVDVKHPLVSHPLYAFVQNFILCAYYGASPSYVDDIVSSPYFPEEKEGDKIAFRNYMAKYGKYKGAVKRECDKELCSRCGIDAEAAERVRVAFADALKIFEDKKSDDMGKAAYEATKTLFSSDKFDIEGKSDDIYSRFKEDYFEEAEFARRAPKAILEVMEEAADLFDGRDKSEYLKVLKSGMNSKRLSLTPAKLDAVFVSDVSATLCMDKRVVFAARMTDAVPAAAQDTKFISDKDIEKLGSEKGEWRLNLGPKTAQGNRIKRETVALNVCSTESLLYLGYSSRTDGDEHERSEVFEYVDCAFLWSDEKNPDETSDKMKIEKVSNLKKRDEIYYCTEFVPALMWAAKNTKDGDARRRTVMERLEKTHGEDLERMKAGEHMSDEKGKGSGHERTKFGKELFYSYGDKNAFAPTTLEKFFKCPYLNFVEKGLGASGSASDDTTALDIGNFVHETMSALSREYVKGGGRSDGNRLAAEENFVKRAEELAREKLCDAPYNALLFTKKGEYDAKRLVEETKAIAKEVLAQIECSKFDIEAAEAVCELDVGEEGSDERYTIKGRVDRVDRTSERDGDMVRVIDYKTGSKTASAREYYMGENLQLPLYLLAETKRDGESEESQPIGAFYFPARIEYSSEEKGMALTGFAEGTEEAVEALDETLQPGEKSKHVNVTRPKKPGAERNGASSMKKGVMKEFLEYGKLLAASGIDEMTGGYIEPSPIENACVYCNLKGCCGFETTRGGAERSMNRKITVDVVVRSAEKAMGVEVAPESEEEA